MPRILLLITDLEIGGTPTVVRELATRLRAAGGTEIEVACLSPWGPVATEIKNAGIPVTALQADGALSLPRVIYHLFRLIRQRRFDTVFSFLVHANAVAAVTSRFCPGVRWFQSIQTTQPTPRWHWIVQSVAQFAAEKIIVPSPSVAQVAMDWASVPAEKIVVIPNAVDSAPQVKQTFLSTANADDANQAGMSAAPHRRVGFIGRLDPIKRIPDLLEAITLLETGVNLHIFGEGADRGRIEDHIHELELAYRVTLHGAISRPHEALQQMDVLVLPSQAEGFGLVLIEAMAAGVPVVASDVPGIREVVRGGETGLLVPVATPAAIAAAVNRLLTDAGLRCKLIETARQDVRRRFSWDVVLPQYQRLLGTTRA